jgi:hypothetical protein
LRQINVVRPACVKVRLDPEILNMTRKLGRVDQFLRIVVGAADNGVLLVLSALHPVRDIDPQPV